MWARQRGAELNDGHIATSPPHSRAPVDLGVGAPVRAAGDGDLELPRKVRVVRRGHRPAYTAPTRGSERRDRPPGSLQSHPSRSDVCHPYRPRCLLALDARDALRGRLLSRCLRAVRHLIVLQQVCAVPANKTAARWSGRVVYQTYLARGRGSRRLRNHLQRVDPAPILTHLQTPSISSSSSAAARLPSTATARCSS